jgi:hypothetical protein
VLQHRERKSSAAVKIIDLMKPECREREREAAMAQEEAKE